MSERINYDSRKKIILSYDRRTPVVIKVPGTEQLKNGMRLSPNLPSLQAFGWAMTTNVEGFKAYRLPGNDYQTIILSFEADAQDVTLTIDGQSPKKYKSVKTVQLLDGVIELTLGRRSPASGDTQTISIDSNLSATRPGILDTAISRPQIPVPGPVVAPRPSTGRPSSSVPIPHPVPSPGPYPMTGRSPEEKPTVLIPQPSPGRPSSSVPRPLLPASPGPHPMTGRIPEEGPTILTPQPSPGRPAPSVPAPAPSNPPSPDVSHPALPAGEDLRARVRDLEIESSDRQRRNLELQNRLDDALRMRDQALARAELFDLNDPEIRMMLEEYRSSLNVLHSCTALSGSEAESVEGLLDQAGQLINRAVEQLRLLIEQRERRAGQINHAVSTGSGLVEWEV